MAAGKEIKRLRGKNITASQAASLIGVGVDRLRKWEERDTDPSDTGDIAKVERYFGVTLSDLKTLKSFDFVETPRGTDLLDNKDLTMQAILNLTESNRILAESNRSLARSNEELTIKVTGGSVSRTYSTVLSTLQGLREYTIELGALVNNTSPNEAEAALGIKVVEALKNLEKSLNPEKKDIRVGESK